MPNILEVQPDIAAKIAAGAQAEGVTVDDYLRSLLEEKATKEESTKALSPHERVRLLREWASSHQSTASPLSDDSISRESMYGERG